MRWDPKLPPADAQATSFGWPADSAARCGAVRTGLAVTGYLEGFMHPRPPTGVSMQSDSGHRHIRFAQLLLAGLLLVACASTLSAAAPNVLPANAHRSSYSG